MLRRSVPLALALLIALSGTTALAQSEADVERAAAEVEAASAEAGAANAAHASASNRLLAAILTYETTTLTLEAVSFDLAAAETAILEDERRLSDLRHWIEDIAAGLYMMGPDLGGFLDSADSTMAGLVIERVVADIEAEMTTIDILRDGLDTSRSDADELRRDLSRIRTDHVSSIDTINELLDGVEVRQQVAAQRKADADVAYKTAVTELEKARKGITPKVEAWGELVATYFPKDQYWNALQVMACESRGTPTALNPTSDAAGLFQFLPGTWLIASKGAGYEGAHPYEPEANIASAAWLVQRSIDWDHPDGAWGHWACRRVLVPSP